MKFTLIKSRNIPFLGVDDTWLIIFGIPLLSFIVPWLFFGMSLYEAWCCFAASWPFAIASTAIFWLGDRRIAMYFRKRFQQVSENSKRVRYSSVSIALYTIVLSAVMHIGLGFVPQNAGNPFQGASILLGIAASLFATALVTALYETIYYIHRWKQTIAVAEKLKRENTQAQLLSLKNQVNPHFLFNSLNTLSSLITEDQRSAVDFVRNLSTVYRGMLDQSDKSAITVAEELKWLESYIFLIKSRFGDNVQFHVRVEHNVMSLYMLAMSLQMLVENAIKHNVVSQRHPLHIEIYNEGTHALVVRNHLQPRLEKPEGTGTGLHNIRERYKLAFGKPIEVTETTTHFEVRLPLNRIAEYHSEGGMGT